MRARESPGNSDIYSKLETAESKLGELKSNMGRLGKEAVLAMAAVEADQQSTTLEKLITVVSTVIIKTFSFFTKLLKRS